MTSEGKEKMVGCQFCEMVSLVVCVVFSRVVGWMGGVIRGYKPGDSANPQSIAHNKAIPDKTTRWIAD